VFHEPTALSPLSFQGNWETARPKTSLRHGQATPVWAALHSCSRMLSRYCLRSSAEVGMNIAHLIFVALSLLAS